MKVFKTIIEMIELSDARHLNDTQLYTIKLATRTIPHFGIVMFLDSECRKEFIG